MSLLEWFKKVTLLMSSIQLHLDVRPGCQQRGQVFGHSNSICPFEEGYIAKKATKNEIKFYQVYKEKLYKYFPENLLPEILGIVEFEKPIGEYVAGEDVMIKNLRDLETINLDEDMTGEYMVQKDIAAGFQRPCILDLKIGVRTWRIGASKKKAARRREKNNRGPNHELKFRVRGGEWYSDNKEKWSHKEMLSYVGRDFSKYCTLEQLKEFLFDFFKHRNELQFVINKLEELEDGLKRLHELGIRFYSSSVLVVYDEMNPEKVDCRMLDFEKSYLDVKSEAEKYGESLEECEDGVVAAISNLKSLLKSI